MKELLEWIEKEGFEHTKKYAEKGLYWYKRGSYRPWRPIIYYTHNELIQLYEKNSN